MRNQRLARSRRIFVPLQKHPFQDTMSAGEIPHGNPKDLVRILRLRAEATPHQNVFKFLEESGEAGQSFSYADLDRRAKAIAAELSRLGKPGDRVLLLYPPCLEFIAGFFGCLYAGMIAVPAYPPKNNRHMARLKAILDDADSVLALSKPVFLRENKKTFRCPGTRAQGFERYPQ